MADIAFVFGWQPDAMERLSVADLMKWREEAALRHNPEEGNRGS